MMCLINCESLQIREQIEALDPDRICVEYWEGRQHLEVLQTNHEASKQPPKT